MAGRPMNNTLYYGDNLTVLREYIRDETVDLIYLDPPFNSQVTYNVLFRTPTGEPAEAQAEAFVDTWKWGPEAQQSFDEVIARGGPAAGLLRALHSFFGNSDMMAYLANMAARLVEMHRVLKPTGSLYLHCDPTASHYLKVLLDGIFGAERFLNEVVWKRTNARGTTGRWPRVHDVLLHYAKGREFTFHAQKAKADKAKLPHTLITGSDGKKYQTYELTAPGVTKVGESGKPWRGFGPSKMGRHWGNNRAVMDDWDAKGLIHWPKNNGFPRRRDEKPFDPNNRMVTVADVWTDIDRLNQTAKERLGYPTQKPLALLDRIIGASSNEGDLVLDPFCGCGTTVHAAEALGRRWIGIDITHYAITLIERRLQEHFAGIDIDMVGRPRDLAGARDLAARDKYQFQWWATWLLEPHAYREERKGGDRGIDGLYFFRNGPMGTGLVIVSVKGGENVTPAMIRDLRGTIEREDAEMGVLVTLTPPTRGMIGEAAGSGYVNTAHGRKPRVQIATVEDLLVGRKPDLPPPFEIHSRHEMRGAGGAIRKLETKSKQLTFTFPISGGKRATAAPPLGEAAQDVAHRRGRSA